MSDWTLSTLLAKLHDDIEHRLSTAREAFGHPTTKGDASEQVWLEMLSSYLPRRYEAQKAHVVDSQDNFSQQMDIVVFDRQYSPFIFDYQGQKVIPAESVYAVFEAKQAINAHEVNYSQEKIESVRKLHRTSLPIPHAGGIYPPKPLPHIIGGLLTFESDWKPPIGRTMIDVLNLGNGNRRLDLGCIAAHGIWRYDDSQHSYATIQQGKPATAFLLELIARLQTSATVPMIDVRAYAKWLTV